MITVVSFDAHNVQEGVVWLDLGAIGQLDDAVLTVDDAVTGAAFTWGREFFVRSDPPDTLAHAAAVRHP